MTIYVRRIVFSRRMDIHSGVVCRPWRKVAILHMNKSRSHIIFTKQLSVYIRIVLYICTFRLCTNYCTTGLHSHGCYTKAAR